MDETRYLQLNDKLTVQQVLSGQTQVYGDLVERYWKLALATAYTKCHNPATAEDIAQDSFIKAYQHLATLRNPSQFVGWLMKIIHQECISHHRQKKPTISIDSNSIGNLHSVFVTKTNPGLTREQIDFVHQAIQKLPWNLQRVVIMRFMGGLPLKEIAKQIEIKYGTVRVWLHRAYKLLKEDLAPILEEVQS